MKVFRTGDGEVASRVTPSVQGVVSTDADLRAGRAPPQNVTLSPIHYRAVQRIYGEHGQQMVKLVRENPAYAIPIVFKRLQQKDFEWCAVMQLCYGQVSATAMHPSRVPCAPVQAHLSIQTCVVRHPVVSIC